MTRRTPLAWKNLTHDPRRLAVAGAGVGFAVLLMFIELGFRNALLDSTVQIIRVLEGDLIIVSRAKYTVTSLERFDIRRTQQAGSVPGVASVHPVYVESWESLLRLPGQRARRIRVLAADLEHRVLRIPELDKYAASLRRPGTALVDEASHANFEFPLDSSLAAYDGELAGQRLELVGPFHLGLDFVTEGNLFMTAVNFAKYFPNRAFGKDPLSLVDVGVVDVEEGMETAKVQAALRQMLPDDVDVVTRDHLLLREKRFWQQQAPVGYIFFVGVCVGFVVGVIVCYQIIHADITDHMPEFATLKAMGYRDRYFFGLVIGQSFYLSLFGFLPGLAASLIVYRQLVSITGLTMQMTPDVVLMVFLATVAMCTVSGLLALRQLLSADPASLF